MLVTIAIVSGVVIGWFAKGWFTTATVTEIKAEIAKIDTAASTDLKLFVEKIKSIL